MSKEHVLDYLRRRIAQLQEWSVAAAGAGDDHMGETVDMHQAALLKELHWLENEKHGRPRENPEQMDLFDE